MRAALEVAAGLTGTKVQILTQMLTPRTRRREQEPLQGAPRAYLFYWLYWYKSTNTDAAHPPGASSNHFRSLLGLLGSLDAHFILAGETPDEKKKDHRHSVSVAVFNLGLSVREMHELALAVPAARLRELEWSAYPSHVRNLPVAVFNFLKNPPSSIH